MNNCRKVDNTDCCECDSSSSGVTINNVGSGNGLVVAPGTGSTFDFKSLVAGTDITLTPSADSITISSSGAGVNIYNSDGTLTGARTVNMGSNFLTFNNGTFSTFGSVGTILGGAIIEPNLSLAPTVGFARDNIQTFDVSTKQVYYMPTSQLPYVNLYNTDSVLTSARTAGLNSNFLIFDGGNFPNSAFAVRDCPSGISMTQSGTGNITLNATVGAVNITGTTSLTLNPGIGGQLIALNTTEAFNYASYKPMVQNPDGRIGNFQTPGFSAHLSVNTVITTVGPHYISSWAVSFIDEFTVKNMLNTITGQITPPVSGHYLLNFECTTRRSGGPSFVGSFVLERNDGFISSFGFTNTCVSNDIGSKAYSNILILETGFTYRIRVDLSTAATVIIFAPDYTVTPKMAGTRLSCKLLM